MKNGSYDNRNFQAMLTGAALSIITNILIALIAPNYYYDIIFIIIVLTSILLIARIFLKIHEWKNGVMNSNGRKARKSN